MRRLGFDGSQGAARLLPLPVPWLIGLVAFWLIPIVASFVLSFSEWHIITPLKWVGLANYREMIRRPVLLAVDQGHAEVHGAVRAAVPRGRTAAVLVLNLKIRGINVFRTILFVPSVLSGVAVAVLWSRCSTPTSVRSTSTLRSARDRATRRGGSTSPTWAVPSVVLIGLWAIGGGAIIYLAGLQNIAAQLYEAALLDGAGPWQRFRYVTLPMLTPTLLFVLITGLIDAFQVFDVAFILSGGGGQGGGGGGESLRFYLLNMWNEAFVKRQYGYASALSWVLVLAAAAVILADLPDVRRWVYYEYDPERAAVSA